MSSASSTAPSSSPSASRPESKGFVRDWVLPIAVGLVLGAAIVGGWKYGPAMLASDAEKIVRAWQPGEFEQNEELDGKLRGLGKDARADVLAAFRAVQVPKNAFNCEEEQKVWVGRVLAGEPYFDSRSLLEIARDEGAPVWDRRCAAAALVLTLGKEVDPTAVVEPLLQWIEDLETLDHAIPLRCLGQLSRYSLFPPAEGDRALRARLQLASKDARPLPPELEDQLRLAADRELAVGDLGEKISRDEVKKALWDLALDESDDVRVRVAALRTLGSKAQFKDTLAQWKRLASSAEVVIRQTVVDNLGTCEDPAYDDVIAPLHQDEGELVRVGSIESQILRNRATMLPILGLLVEDASPYVRRQALLAAGHFKNHLDELAQRKGMVLRAFETSDDDEDIAGAVGALRELTGETFGFAAGDVDAEGATEASVAAFKADVEGRRQAAQKFRELLGPGAVWTDADRKPWLEKLLQSKDPKNRERAQQELDELSK